MAASKGKERLHGHTDVFLRENARKGDFLGETYGQALKSFTFKMLLPTRLLGVCAEVFRNFEPRDHFKNIKRQALLTSSCDDPRQTNKQSHTLPFGLPSMEMFRAD